MHHRSIAMKKASATERNTFQVHALLMTASTKHCLKGSITAPIVHGIPISKLPGAMLSDPSVYQSRWNAGIGLP